ncbi:E3 ubiquitin/ISG15 ligase TRIM25 [Aplochiton taeniatus]
MASSLQDQSSVLQDELTCPVCLDVYRDPHLLPCGHSFCMSCLRRLKRQAERSRFRCPECRESHRCGGTFQKNFKLANIADDYRRRSRTAAAAAARDGLLPALGARPSAKVPLSVPCDYCPAVGGEAGGTGPAGEGASGAAGGGGGGATAPRVVAVKTCLKCEVSMCKEHVRPHLELPAFREHPLTEPLADLRRRKCQEHDEMFRYYCLEDKVCVCNACTIEGGHSGHTIKTLKNSMKDLRRLIDKQIRYLENKASRAEQKLHEQKEKERENKRFEEESEQRLTVLAEELKAKVDLFVASLRDSTRSHCGLNGTEIQRNITRIRQDQERLQVVRRGLDSLMQENDPFCFIETYRTDGKQ